MICQKCGENNEKDDNIIRWEYLGFKCKKCGYINSPKKEFKEVKKNQLQLTWFQNEIRKKLRR